MVHIVTGSLRRRSEYCRVALPTQRLQHRICSRQPSPRLVAAIQEGGKPFAAQRMSVGSSERPSRYPPTSTAQQDGGRDDRSGFGGSPSVVGGSDLGVGGNVSGEKGGTRSGNFDEFDEDDDFLASVDIDVSRNRFTIRRGLYDAWHSGENATRCARVSLPRRS